jgi:DNA-directed RNA polymerase subunit RPC12/RpoP
MDITFRCDHCGQSIEIDGAGAGTVIECPKCSESVLVFGQKQPTKTAYITQQTKTIIWLMAIP